MKKILCMLLTACILLTAAGCNGGNTEDTLPGSTSGAGKTESTHRPSQTPGSTVPDGAPTDLSDVPFDYKASKVTVPVKPIGLTDPGSYQFIEDADGILHLIYQDKNRDLCHRYLNERGVWSDAQVIDVYISLDEFNKARARGEATVLSGDIDDFYTLLSPDGELCVVWAKNVVDVSGSDGSQNLFYTAYYRNGGFEQALPIEYPADDETLSIFRIDSVYFDAQGTMQCLYNSRGPNGGFFLSGNRLTRLDWEHDMSEIPVAEGLSHWGSYSTYKFTVDSRGVCHIFTIDGEEGTSEQTLIHSYSKDNGVTWEGPFTVLENLPDIYEFNCSSYINGEIQLAIRISHGWDRKKLVLCTLEADTYKVISHQEYFGYREMSDAVSTKNQYDYELSGFQSCAISSVYYSSDGLLCLIGNVSYMKCFVFEQDRKGAWDIRMLTVPDNIKDNMVSGGVFLRSNGKLFLFCMYRENDLYWGEVAW